MNKDEIEQLKLRIQKQLKRCRNDIEYLEDLTRPIAPENSIGRVTRMDAINNKSVNEATLRQARTTLAQLEIAIQRIDQEDKEYGLCSSCGAEIPFQRMLLMPHSDKCVNCAR